MGKRSLCRRRRPRAHCPSDPAGGTHRLVPGRRRPAAPVPRVLGGAAAAARAAEPPFCFSASCAACSWPSCCTSLHPPVHWNQIFTCGRARRREASRLPPLPGRRLRPGSRPCLRGGPARPPSPGPGWGSPYGAQELRKTLTRAGGTGKLKPNTHPTATPRSSTCTPGLRGKAGAQLPTAESRRPSSLPGTNKIALIWLEG